MDIRNLPSSPGVRALNPHLFQHGATVPILPAAQASARPKGTGMGKPRARKPMNKTETAFSHLLEASKRRGEIIRWEREGITLRWPDGMTYTPDFAVLDHSRARVFIETKGPHIRDDAMVKFRAARAHWPEHRFEMHQLKKGEWTQIL